MIIPNFIPWVICITVFVVVFIICARHLGYETKEEFYCNLIVSLIATGLVYLIISIPGKTIIVIENGLKPKEDYSHKVIRAYGHPIIKVGNTELSTDDLEIENGRIYLFNCSDVGMLVYPEVYTESSWTQVNDDDIPESVYIESGCYREIESKPDYWFTSPPEEVSSSNGIIEGIKSGNSGSVAIRWFITPYTPYSFVFDKSKPVDLSNIINLYKKSVDNKIDYEVLLSRLLPDAPIDQDDIYLFSDTSFVLRLPEYSGTEHPFLAYAEDLFNGMQWGWNLYSNYEVWLRGNTADLLREDKDVINGINGLSVNVIKDLESRNAAVLCRDSILMYLGENIDDWDDDISPADAITDFTDVIYGKSYDYYGDIDIIADSAQRAAESFVLEKYQRYLDADEDVQLKVILDELASCVDFDDQCSLWRNWANSEKSILEDEWIVAVGTLLMDSGNYNPILDRLWITWRALFQTVFCGSSRDSYIPNDYYNIFRRKCYISCLKHIAEHQDDVFAMNCATILAVSENMNRFGQNQFGNEALIDEAWMMPRRYGRE